MNTAEIIDITQYLPVTKPVSIENDSYSDFREDLFQLKLSVKDFADLLGIGQSAVYSWKQNGVPAYAHKFLDMCMRLADAEIRLGKRDPESGFAENE